MDQRPPRPRQSASRRSALAWATALAMASILTGAVAQETVPGADAPAFDDIRDHFKYGSVGTEERVGVPYWIWRVLPDLCADKLPKRPGNGYERIGFISDGASHGRPIGTSWRKGLLPTVGLNCATCHVGTIRETPAAPRRVVLGMPANQMDLQAYARFLTACASDSRFEPEPVLAAIDKAGGNFSFLDRAGYRYVVVPRVKREVIAREKENSWFEGRPPFGVGRVDTFNPYKVMLGLT